MVHDRVNQQQRRQMLQEGLGVVGSAFDLGDTFGRFPDLTATLRSMQLVPTEPRPCRTVNEPSGRNAAARCIIGSCCRGNRYSKNSREINRSQTVAEIDQARIEPPTASLLGGFASWLEFGGLQPVHSLLTQFAPSHGKQRCAATCLLISRVISRSETIKVLIRCVFQEHSISIQPFVFDIALRVRWTVSCRRGSRI